MKKPIALRLSDDAIELLRTLSERLGLSMAGVVELAIRTLARSEKVELDAKRKPTRPRK